MSLIGEQLKRLRADRGLTQEEVAARVGLTRQAISSYESDRTQPDLEMLRKLAEVYDVPVQDFLSGEEQAPRGNRSTRVLSVVTAGFFLLCNTAHSVLLWIANRRFRIPEGQLAPEMKEALQWHMTLVETAERVEVILALGFPLLCILLLIQAARRRPPVAAKARWACLGLLAVGAILTTVPWAAADPVFGWWNYGYPAVAAWVRALELLVISLLVEWLLRKR